jgi:hypothetical protein
MGYIKDVDVMAAAQLPEVVGDEEMPVLGWDKIV